MDDLRPDIKDILLQDIGDEKNRKIKKLLTLIAMIIVLFLIILIIMKFVNGKDEVFDDDIAISLPVNTDKDYEEIEKEIKEGNKPQEETRNDKNIQQILNNYNNTQNVKKDILDEIVRRPIIPLKEEPAPKPIAEQPNNSMQVVPQPKPTPTKLPVVVQPTPTKPATPVAKPTTPTTKPADLFANTKQSTQTVSSNTQKGTYIQIASATKLDLNSPLLKDLQAKGYKYTLYDTKINGVNYTKVLIGPYKTEADYQKALIDARKNLHEQAYRFTVN
jgi:DedD protein